MTTHRITTYSFTEQLLAKQGYQPKSEQELLNHIYHIILGFFSVVSCKVYCYSNIPIKSELYFSVWVLVSKNDFFFFSKKHFLLGLATNKVNFLNVFTPGMRLASGFSIFSSAPGQPKILTEELLCTPQQ